MFQVTLRLDHGCLFCDLSARHPGLAIALWCNFRGDIAEVRVPDARTATRLEQDLRAMSPTGLASFSRRGRVCHAVLRCPHRRRGSIEGTIERAGCIPLPPTVYRDGVETHRMLAPEGARLPALLAELGHEGPVDMLRKRPVRGTLFEEGFILPARDLFSELTDKQAEALVAAIDAGYYEVPRRTHIGAIAESRAIPRTTFEEHARKAEAKVIRAVAPYLEMHTAFAGDGDLD